jgi:hypothetical protein
MNMETAKVDIRKLQLLNDRINQTIEALNQVRLSVHGIQHTAMQSQVSPFGYGQPQQAFGYGMPQQAFGYGLPQTGFQGQFATQMPLPFTGGIGGIGHSPWQPQWQPQQTWQGWQGWHGLEGDQGGMARVVQTFPYALAQQPFVY